MRKIATLPLPFVLLILFTTSTFAQAPANMLEGTWKITQRTEVRTDTTIVFSNVPSSVKILNSTHFAWGYQTDNGEDVLAGGGRYELLGDTLYVEYIDYHTSPVLVGVTIEFKAQVEGDTWYHTGQLGDFLLVEVWQRVKDEK